MKNDDKKNWSPEYPAPTGATHEQRIHADVAEAVAEIEAGLPGPSKGFTAELNQLNDTDELRVENESIAQVIKDGGALGDLGAALDPVDTDDEGF
jgi:hypothetical protein